MMMKKVLAGIGILLLVALAGVAWLLIPRPYKAEYRMTDVPIADFSQAPSGEVWFPGYNARNAKDLQDGGAHAVQEPVIGTLVLPPEASAEHPVPAFVILHGSGGDFTHRSTHLAEKLARVGIAGFAVDTFRSRKLTEKDDYFLRLQKATAYTQIADGLNALKMLQQHPFIRKDRIGVAGFSLGAASALLTAFEPVDEGILGKNGPRFAAHVMFYGGCNLDFDDFRLDGAPWLIMLGQRDESTPPDTCRELMARVNQLGVHTEMKIYPGAAHAWNAPEPLSFHKNAFVTRDCTTYWTRDGRLLEKHTGLSYDNPVTLLIAFSQCADKGYSMGRHDAANRQSVRDMLAFLDREWGGDWSARLTDDVLDIGIAPGPEQSPDGPGDNVTL
jgi:dienelactone hydrolase